MGSYKYTPVEDGVIKRCVSENPDNLTKAFKNASDELGRSASGVSFRWYNTLSKDGVTLLTVTSKSHTINKKSDTRGTRSYLKENKKLSKWRRILNILKE